MKYIHIYDDSSYCESDSFKGTPNTIVLTDEQYEQLGETLKFSNGQLAVMTPQEIQAIQGNNYDSTVH